MSDWAGEGEMTSLVYFEHGGCRVAGETGGRMVRSDVEDVVSSLAKEALEAKCEG